MDEIAMVKITLDKSLIGVPLKHRKIVRALGLRKKNSWVMKKDNPAIQGMIFKIQHLLKVERVKK
jgi:large subunit ribosomal protein L30